MYQFTRRYASSLTLLSVIIIEKISSQNKNISFVIILDAYTLSSSSSLELQLLISRHAPLPHFLFDILSPFSFSCVPHLHNNSYIHIRVHAFTHHNSDIPFFPFHKETGENWGKEGLRVWQWTMHTHAQQNAMPRKKNKETKPLWFHFQIHVLRHSSSSPARFLRFRLKSTSSSSQKKTTAFISPPPKEKHFMHREMLPVFCL